ncbi:hypothetical protein D9M70_599170 [compost metagenome]
MEDLAVRVDLREVRVEKTVQLLDCHDGLDRHRHVSFVRAFAASEAGMRFCARRKKVLVTAVATDLKAGNRRRTTGTH